MFACQPPTYMGSEMVESEEMTTFCGIFLGTINHTQATWIRSVSLHTFCVHKCPVLSAKRKSKKLYKVPYAHKPIVRPKAADKESRVSSDGKLSTTRVDKGQADYITSTLARWGRGSRKRLASTGKLSAATAPSP